jgi:hypothetical protein
MASVIVISIAMAIYAYVRLTANHAVLLGVIALLALMSALRIFLRYRRAAVPKYDVGFEIAFSAVLFSVLLGPLRASLSSHPFLLFSTIFYRPEYMTEGSRRLALVLSIIIAVVVLPATCGIVTASSTVDFLSVIYSAIVLSLWIFCSKISAIIVGSPR